MVFSFLIRHADWCCALQLSKTCAIKKYIRHHLKHRFPVEHAEYTIAITNTSNVC